MELKITFSSLEIIGEKRSNISVSIGGFEEENMVVKWEDKFPPISALEDT